METFLIVQRGEDIGRRYDLDAAQLTVGRGADNDLVLNDPMVSRYHAVVKRQGSRCAIIDLGSANPVVINDQALEAGIPQQVQHRDVIFIGKTVFSFQNREARPGAQPSVPAPEATHMAPLPPAEPPAREGARERQTPPPHTPTMETPPVPAAPGAVAGNDEGRTVLYASPDATPAAPGPASRAGDNDDRTIAAGVRLDELANHPSPPPPPTPPGFATRDDEPTTTPGAHPGPAAVPPLPPLGTPQGRGGAEEEGEDRLIGTPPDDDDGDSPTVFIPRERR